MSLTKACTEADIDRIIADHVRAARGAREAGFDAIEVHFGHNYLVSEFLSPAEQAQGAPTAARSDRARFARRIGRAVRDIAVATRSP